MANTLADITAKVMPKSGGDIASLTIGGKTVITSDGGVLNGAIVTTNGEAIRGSHDYGNVTIRGGTDYQKGSQISFYGKDHESYAGLIHMIAYDDTHGMKSGYMYPDGKFTWDGKNIVRSVNGTSADASGNVALGSIGFDVPMGNFVRASFRISGGKTGTYTVPCDCIFIFDAQDANVKTMINGCLIGGSVSGSNTMGRIILRLPKGATFSQYNPWSDAETVYVLYIPI